MHPETKAKGDNDPLDVCEIGEQVGYVGQVKQVKVLGIMALLDEGETDWKVLVVDVQDPLASKLNDIEDVERHLPGLIRATNEWFRYHFQIKIYYSIIFNQKYLYVESTRSPTESQKTHLLSLVRQRTRNTQLRLFTNATKPGVVLSPVKAQPRPLLMISPCQYNTITQFVILVAYFRHLRSSNVTQENSPGLVRLNDPAYTSLPAEKREPPAPIDPSSKNYY